MIKTADDQNVGEEKETRKSGTATGDCIKSDLERVGEEWRKEQQIEGIGDR